MENSAQSINVNEKHHYQMDYYHPVITTVIRGMNMLHSMGTVTNGYDK
jgi:hypothetical protein